MFQGSVAEWEKGGRGRRGRDGRVLRRMILRGEDEEGVAEERKESIDGANLASVVFGLL